ncbi:MAG TPA: MerR family transcriptional regulator [Methylocella sp.]|nr:MerR family transcriptional regulator [Methylocella sp.]
MNKSADAFRTISEVAGELDLPQHVLRFWESRFPQIKPLKRAGGRRYYRPRDVEVLRAVKHLLYGEGYTIKGVQRVLKEQGIGGLAAARETGGASGASGVPALQQREGEEFETARSFAAQDSAAPGSGTPAVLADGQAVPSSAMLSNAVWSCILTDEDISRLRAALAELAACEEILEAVRRR